MLTLQEIRNRLKVASLGKVSKAAGCHYNTLKDIRDNQESNPTWRIVKSLSDYFLEVERASDK